MSFNIENYLLEQQKGDVILYYKGNIDSDVINCILDTVENKLIQMNEHVRLLKKVYNVLVESLQNLYHHVDKVPPDFEDQSAEKFGILMIRKIDGGYRIITGNFIKKENIEKLEEKIKRLNKSSQDEIKELYKFILNHQRITNKGGGGLGLVDIARKTGNKFEYKFTDYDNDHSFFYLNILVS